MTNVEKSILKWHKMEKSAGAMNLGSVATVMGAPSFGSMVAGYGYGKFTQPSDKDLQLLQAKYVTAKIQQSIEELEEQKKLQMLKEKFSGKPNTLRI
jgi:hypothetical protein